MKRDPRFLIPALALLALLAGLSWAGGAHAQTRGPAMPPPGPAAAADLAALYHQHILAINRGDVAAVVAGYAPDAVFIGPGAPPCSVSAPCAGKDAIQGLFQGLIAAKLQAGIIDLQASGNTLTSRLNILTDGIRAAGFRAARVKVTVTFTGDKITRDVVEYDTSDPATAAYATFVRQAAVLRQHFDALSKGDISGALAVFAGDAVLGRGALCPPTAPCQGLDAIRRGLEVEARDEVRITVLEVRRSGNNVMTREEWAGISQRNAGVSRSVRVHTASFSGDKIVRLTAENDASDAETAAFLNFVRVAPLNRRRDDAINRGDVTAAMATFTDDAVFEGFGPCRVAPCVGREAIQRAIERLVADNTLITEILGITRVAGNTFTTKRQVTNDVIRGRGTDRIIFNVTAEVPGTRVAHLRFEFDTTDEQTAGWVAAIPTRLPATGNGGLADESREP